MSRETELSSGGNNQNTTVPVAYGLLMVLLTMHTERSRLMMLFGRGVDVCAGIGRHLYDERYAITVCC